MKTRKAVYLAINKDNDELYCEEIKYNPEMARMYINRAKAILESPQPLERECRDKTWFLAKFCDYCDICFKED